MEGDLGLSRNDLGSNKCTKYIAPRMSVGSMSIIKDGALKTYPKPIPHGFRVDSTEPNHSRLISVS